MRRFLRTWLSFGAVLIVTGSAAGISGAASPRHMSRSVVNLVMWQQWGGGHEKRTLDKYIALFNRTHPGIHVTEEPVTDNTKIVTAISGGRPPDFMDLATTGTIGQWAHNGLIQPMDSYIHQSHINMSAFYPAGWRVVTYEGKHWGVPFLNFDVGLLYNRKLFRQAHIAHPPRTLEELTADAHKLTIIKNGRIQQMGFIPDYPAGNLQIYGWLFGGDWFHGNKSIADNPANVKALQWESSFYKKYGAKNVKRFMAGFGQYLTAADGFESGKVAMMLDGAWNMAFINENVKGFQYGTAPFPGPSGKRTGTTYLDTDPQVIPTGSPHPKEAMEFIKWEATNPSLTAEFATLIMGLPQLKHVPQTKLFKDPKFQVFLRESTSKYAHQLPQTPISAQFATNLSNAEQSVLLGKSPPAKALSSLKQTTQQEINGAR